MEVVFTKIKKHLINGKPHEYFSKGKTYRAKHIFPDTWPWMLMAWDNGDVGRYIHGGDFGEYEVLK